eukprot:7690296-Lingulodinium_polyedra.AAC.1
MSGPLHAKLVGLVMIYGGVARGMPVITNIHGFALGFRDCVNVEWFEDHPRRLTRHVLIYGQGFSVRGSAAYCLGVVPFILQALGIIMDAADWHDIHPKLVAIALRGPEETSDHLVPHSDVGSVVQQQLASQQHKHIIVLKAALKCERQKRARVEHKLADAQLEICRLRTDLQRSLAPTDTNAVYSKVSAWRGIGIALRLSISNVAACRVGLALGIDIHHTTVCAWELKANACLQASSRQ